MCKMIVSFNVSIFPEHELQTIISKNYMSAKVKYVFEEIFKYAYSEHRNLTKNY